MQLRVFSAFGFVSVAACPWVTSTVLPQAITARSTAAVMRNRSLKLWLLLNTADAVVSVGHSLWPMRLAGQSTSMVIAIDLQKKRMTRAVAACGALLLFAIGVAAQSEEVKVEILPESNAVRLEVSGTPQKSWSFRDTYGGVIGLGRRVRKFQALDTPGARNSVRELAPGHFELGVSAASISYEVDLSPPIRPADAALVSWLTRERGILRLSDLLPLRKEQPGSLARDVQLKISNPEGWAAYSGDEVTALHTYRFTDPDSAIIFVGKNLRRSVRTSSGNLFKLLTDGTWAFSDEEAMDTLLKVIRLNSEIGALPCTQVTLVLSTFPAGGAGANTWSAETRGCNVVLLMGQTPSRVGALAQLGNALTHETFHLWIPNGVALSGEYDWFYEGFTMYQSARAAVQLGLVTWPEFLNAIAQAYDGSLATTNAQSLIDASKQRWTTGTSTVYSKAMVVAFLYDLNLRNQTGGKRSLDDVYRRMLREHPRRSLTKQAGVDGNAATTSALRGELSSADFVERLISAPVSIDLKKELEPFGLRVEKLVRTHISVGDDLSKRQRDLLKQLGYNEPRARRK